ncbi:hypothetical protein IIC65_02445, partial [Candidatus Sumerlaeota bacterium]|nr:hypothetical protein [Candidatus Sumerlaeota bacterium]
RRRRQRYYALAIEVRSAARVSWDRLQSARSRAIYHRDFVVPLHVRIVEQTQLQYNAMQIGAQRLLLAKQNEIEAGLNYIESLRAYWLARVQLERILSGRLNGEDGFSELSGELSDSARSGTHDNENQGGQSS